MFNWRKNWLNFTLDNNKRETPPHDLLAPAVHLVDLDGADVSEGDVEEGETELLEAVDRPKDHRERSDAESNVKLNILSFDPNLPSPSQ